TPQQPPTSQTLYGLGWDIDSSLSSNRGDFLPVGSFGHTGFTGTSLWIDPTTRTYIIILTNSVHPRGKGIAVPLRSKIATAVAASLQLTVSEKERVRLSRITGYNEAAAGGRIVQVRNQVVKTGIDVLEAGNFEPDLFRRGTSENASTAANATTNGSASTSSDASATGNENPKKRIGVLTNQSGVDSQGRRTIDVLAHAPGVTVTAIFSPEHGVT